MVLDVWEQNLSVKDAIGCDCVEWEVVFQPLFTWQCEAIVAENDGRTTFLSILALKIYNQEQKL